MLGNGAGRWSFVHIDDAVAATVAAVESDLTGAFNICDDDPVALGQWLPAFARVPWGAAANACADRTRARIRIAGSTASCFEGPTTTSLVEHSASIPDPCHGVENTCRAS